MGRRCSLNGMRIDFPYLMPDRDRHGNERVYVRRFGRKIRIREPRGTAAFAQAYADAIAALGEPPVSAANPITAAKVGTFGWLAAKYFGSVEFKSLSASSQTTRRAIIEDCLREPLKPQSVEIMRDCPIARLSAAHVKMLRDRKAATPGAANNRRKYLSAMFGWAVEDGSMHTNPARDVRKLSYASEGFYTWTVEDVRQFEARHQIGTKARLALALLLYLGVRRGDVVKIGPSQVKNGWLHMVPRKTRHKRKDVVQKPVLPVLVKIISETPLVGSDTYLVTQYGKPFTANGFGGWFRERCDEAGLHQCSAHGLRKAGATLAAENGATDRQLMALYDWTTAAQANVYTAAANRKRMAGEAARLLSDGSDREPAHGQDQEQSAPPKLPHQEKPSQSKELKNPWQEWRDSNPQPPVLETGALAIELHS
jgi:integrase